MNKIVALVYWIFKTDKKQTTPYFATCLLLTLILVINIASLAILFKVSYDTFSFEFIADEKLNRWVNTIIKGTFLWILFVTFFPQKKLELSKYSNSQLAKGRRNLIIIFVISIIIMSLLLIKSGIDRGLI